MLGVFEEQQGQFGKTEKRARVAKVLGLTAVRVEGG